MAVRFKEKLYEGIIIGLTTSIMIIFITFLWQQALKVATAGISIEEKIEEVITYVNNGYDVIEERLVEIENRPICECGSNPIDVAVDNYVEDILPAPAPAPAPMPEYLMGEPEPDYIYEEQRDMEQRAIPRIKQYEPVLKR